MKNLFILVGLINFVLCGNLKAEIKAYESIDNAGLNKAERIEVIDKYMVNLVTSIKNMESKLDENTKKMKSLEVIVNALKEAEAKKVEASLGERKTNNAKDLSEVEKLKADILILKNQDIEKLKVNFEELNDTVKILQATLKAKTNN